MDGGAYTLVRGLGVGTVAVDATASLAGPGTIDGALVNLGSVSTSGGTLTVDGAVSGTGSFIVGSGATLDLAGGGTLAGNFSGAGTLRLDDAAGFSLLAGEDIQTASMVVDSGATLSVPALANALWITAPFQPLRGAPWCS